MNSDITYYSYATDLLHHLRYRCAARKRPSLSRLESILFGGVSSLNSLAFWHDCVRELPDEKKAFDDYIITLFCLFIAMTDEEIDEIVMSYFNSPLERNIVNRTAV